MHGTVRAQDVESAMPQALRTTGGFVHLITTTAAPSALSAASVSLTAMATRAAAVALRLALASRSET